MKVKRNKFREEVYKIYWIIQNDASQQMREPVHFCRRHATESETIIRFGGEGWGAGG